MPATEVQTLTGITPPATGWFEVAPYDAPIRHTLESRVRSGFGHHFDACIEGFMPDLAVYRHAGGSCGIIGLRDAADETLFLETYLDSPIEAVVAEAARRPVSRGEIVEVGQFIVDDKSIVPDFFRDLVPFLMARGHRWVCFTGTNRIRGLLTKVGFAGKPIATATRERVGAAAASWGSYYEFDPCVIVGKLADPQGDWLTTAD